MHNFIENSDDIKYSLLFRSIPDRETLTLSFVLERKEIKCFFY